MTTDAELEAAYRFVNNPRVTPERILQPHYEATAARGVQAGAMRLIHDTTEFKFAGPTGRRGLGPLRGGGQGFFAHLTLAAAADEGRTPLGVLALTTWTRTKKKRLPKGTPKPRRSKRGGRTDGEALRWAEQAKKAEQRVAPGTRVVHLMDREADSYALISALGVSSFVIRAAHDRVVQLPSELQVSSRDKLKRILADAPILLEREVPLSRRRKAQCPQQRKIHPPRLSRLARLAISARRVRIARTEYVSRELPAWLDLNVVRVAEVDAPPGAPSVEWVLLTNLPIDTPEQVAAIVDHYRARWQIEELNKALKSGCGLEERQLEGVHSLLNTLAILIPVAWQMLALRSVAQHAPEQPAARVLTPTQIEVLCTMRGLPPRPTLRQALLAVARLGGHLRHSGEPGWQTLAAGFHDLRLMALAWGAAAGRENCDQG